MSVLLAADSGQDIDFEPERLRPDRPHPSGVRCRGQSQSSEPPKGPATRGRSPAEGLKTANM